MKEIIKKLSAVNRIAMAAQTLQDQLGAERNIHVDVSIDKAKGILNELEPMLYRIKFWLEKEFEEKKRKEAQS